MKYQIIVCKDGAKRYAILFVDGIATKTMWTGDTNGWVKYKGRYISKSHFDENKKYINESYYDEKNPERIEEYLGKSGISHVRQTDDPHEIGNMLRDLYGKQIEGYCHETNTITIKV